MNDLVSMQFRENIWLRRLKLAVYLSHGTARIGVPVDKNERRRIYTVENQIDGQYHDIQIVDKERWEESSKDAYCVHEACLLVIARLVSDDISREINSLSPSHVLDLCRALHVETRFLSGTSHQINLKSRSSKALPTLMNFSKV